MGEWMWSLADMVFHMIDTVALIWGFPCFSEVRAALTVGTFPVAGSLPL